jgi:hypothetical protein
MARIKTYRLDTFITDNDILIGSDAEGNYETKNYSLKDIREYLLSGLAPEVGGTLKITEVDYDGVLTTPSAVLNALNPALSVLQYNVLIVSVNGDKYIFKLQDVIVGITEEPILDSDFILLSGSVNVGDGSEVIKGINPDGKKEYRSVKAVGTLATVTENVDVIEVSIDEDVLNTFIEDNQKKYTVENVGGGIELYKDTTVVSDLSTFNIKTINSTTLDVTFDENNVLINTPETASIPALYVNNRYVPTEAEFLAGNTKGEGTLAKPFTDTITAYTLGVPTITPNTSIQNALDAYVGSGTRLDPELSGQQIIIQSNNSAYTFTGNLEYTNLRLKIEATVDATTSSYLIDMDNSLNIANASITEIEVASNGFLKITGGEGFKNNGTTTATNNFTIYRQIRLIGEGTISFTGNDINKYLLNSDKDSVGNSTTGFINDGAWQFEVRCYLESEFQGLVALGGVSQILSIGGIFQTGTVFSNVNVNLKAFNLKGGTLRLRRNSTVIFYGSNSTTRLKGFIVEPTNGFTPEIEQSNCLMVGNLDTLYSKENNSNTLLNVVQSGSSEMNCIEVFDSTNLWSINFRDNFFNSGSIDFTKVDLTQGNNVSSINTIGGNIIESLVVYTSKAAAKTAGLPVNSIFLKRVTVNAGVFVVGQEYKISTIGTTDFTLIGASANTVGLWFTATGVGAGTGTAYLQTREII